MAFKKEQVKINENTGQKEEYLTSMFLLISLIFSNWK